MIITTALSPNPKQRSAARSFANLLNLHYINRGSKDFYFFFERAEYLGFKRVLFFHKKDAICFDLDWNKVFIWKDYLVPKVKHKQIPFLDEKLSNLFAMSNRLDFDYYLCLKSNKFKIVGLKYELGGLLVGKYTKNRR